MIGNLLFQLILFSEVLLPVLFKYVDIVRFLTPSVSMSELDTLSDGVCLPLASSQLESELFGPTNWPMGPIIGSGLFAELVIVPDSSPADACGESTSPRDGDVFATPREMLDMWVVDSASN